MTGEEEEGSSLICMEGDEREIEDGVECVNKTWRQEQFLLRRNRPSVKFNFAQRVSYPTLFVGSSGVCTDRATEIESIRESVDDRFKFAPKLISNQES